MTLSENYLSFAFIVFTFSFLVSFLTRATQNLAETKTQRGTLEISQICSVLFIFMDQTVLYDLSDDIILNIFIKLEDDPRHWARLACVCTKFSNLVRNVCWKNKCSQRIPSIISDLLSPSYSSGSHLPILSSPPGGWEALYKLSVCCPGLLHAGVLLENSDFGLEREIGPDENYRKISTPSPPRASSSSVFNQDLITTTSSPMDCSWSLFDDLYNDTVYDISEAESIPSIADEGERIVAKVGKDFSVNANKRKNCESVASHLATSFWNLSREQGNKLLASRFRDDCLYICDWPGCIHMEEKRKYMLFRGIFKNFKLSRVWRTIKDGNRRKISLNCAFCSCKETWDLHSAFCLKRMFGYHDDGEPVVRAYVCENGHVSGAWTDRPVYG